MANNLFNQTSNQTTPQENSFQINPQMKAVMNMVKASGMTPKDLFYSKAKEMGIDPDTILSQLK